MHPLFKALFLLFGGGSLRQPPPLAHPALPLSLDFFDGLVLFGRKLGDFLFVFFFSFFCL
jgi:hypothetical protein